jgi:dihydroflavonol-4-reductase
MPGLIYGPGDTSQTGAMMAQVARGKRVLVAKGGGLSWTYVDDVAHGHLLAMTSGQLGTAYIMAGPRETLADVLRRVAALARTKPPVALSDAAVATMAKAAGLLGRFAPLAGNYAAESMRAALATYYGDASKAERELGWTTRDLDAGLAETVRSLRA